MLKLRKLVKRFVKATIFVLPTLVLVVQIISDNFPPVTG